MAGIDVGADETGRVAGREEQAHSRSTSIDGTVAVDAIEN